MIIRLLLVLVLALVAGGFMGAGIMVLIESLPRHSWRLLLMVLPFVASMSVGLVSGAALVFRLMGGQP